MGRIYYMMGKSSSGKDTLFKEVKEALPELRTITLYTTRPLREGETDGVEYHFVTEERLKQYKKEGKVIEIRAYNTVHGIWKYATIDDGQVQLKAYDYLVIGTLDSYERLRCYYGSEQLVPIYIEVEDGERLERALTREREQDEPGYQEMCRRFLADSQDFSEENLEKAGIKKRYRNHNKIQCLEEIIGDIQHGKL